MDFFTQQDKARKFTKILLLYLFIAIACIVLAVNLVIYFFFIFLEFYPYTPENWFSDGVVYYISAATIGLILLGSLYRWKKLKAGGHAVAVMMGAKRIDLHTTDYKERQFINVVEEMSIASGVPLPTIYVLENEQGINAFVAGYQPTEAVIVATKGTIEKLNRAELQGVVAHEFSHILNGDMQINIKLIAILAGILMISVVGKILVPRTFTGRRYGHNSYVSSSRRTGGRNGSAIIILGLALQLLGFIGLMFGRLIKSAVSRQREFLADAAAVQFTRNPEGIASALNQIRTAGVGSLIESAHAEDLSHMCFSQPLNKGFISLGFSKWMATHPPLEDRIKAIDPVFLSREKARQLSPKNKQNEQSRAEVSVEEKNRAVTTVGGMEALMPAALSALAVTQTVGQVQQAHMDYATKVHASFSDELLDAVHGTASAKIVIILLILAKMELKTGVAVLRGSIDKQEESLLKRHKDEVFSLDLSLRLPLFDLLLPALKLMSDEEKTDFISLCKRLIKSDKRYTLFEFILLTLLEQHLSSDAAKNIKIKYYSFKPLKDDLNLLLSVIAHCGGVNEQLREQAYKKVAATFVMDSNGLLPMKDISTGKIKQSLTRLNQLSPLLKRNVIEACADIAIEDGSIKTTELELLRAVSESLNCPMPPLIAEAS